MTLVRINGSCGRRGIWNDNFLPSGGNGCGTPSHWIYGLIPDYPFGNACNNHDVCYSSNVNKSSCDNRFLDHMYSIVDRIAQEIANLEQTDPEQYYPTIALHNAQTLAYYQAVSSLQTALEAYCADKPAYDICMLDQGFVGSEFIGAFVQPEVVTFGLMKSLYPAVKKETSQLQ